MRPLAGDLHCSSAQNGGCTVHISIIAQKLRILYVLPTPHMILAAHKH